VMLAAVDMKGWHVSIMCPAAQHHRVLPDADAAICQNAMSGGLPQLVRPFYVISMIGCCRIALLRHAESRVFRQTACARRYVLMLARGVYGASIGNDKAHAYCHS
jgi:hypothetical protein